VCDLERGGMATSRLVLACVGLLAVACAEARAPTSKRDVLLGAYKAAQGKIKSKPPPAMRAGARQPLAAERPRSFGGRLTERLERVANSTGADGQLSPEAAGMV